jgi:hypothetical protein
MRIISLAIALFVLAGVAYISFSTPSHAEVFGGEGSTASAQAR